MTAAIGNDAVFVPVLPSFEDFFTGLSKNAKKGGKQAGTDFAGAMQDSLKGAEKQVEKSSGVMERAQERFTSASEDTRIAQQKLSEVMEKENATVSQLVAARTRYERAMRKEATAQKDAQKATSEHEKAQRELQVATDQAGDAIEESARGLDAYEGSLDGASAKAADFIKVVGGFAGIAGVGAMLSEGMDISGSIATMNRQLGLTGETARMFGEDVYEVMRGGIAVGADEATEAIGALNSQFAYLGSEGEQTAVDLADNFLAFTKTFEVDMAEATQTAGQLVSNGLATDVESAVDLMTSAMQRVPMQMRDELPEIINEYGVHFAGLGLSGEEAFSLLVSAAEKGKWALDKTGDSLKEFQIRGSDMSKTSVEAYETVGLNAEEMSNKIALGGDGAREALEATATAILGLEDPAERANTAVALFGTPIEDLSIDQIPQFLESLTGAQNEMNGFAGSSQEMSDQISGSLQGRINALKGTVMSLAGDAFMWLWDTIQNQVIPAFQATGEWVQRNQAWLGPLTIALGALTAGMVAFSIAQKASAAGGFIKMLQTMTLVTKAQAAAQLVLNGAMWASPITWIVAGIAAVVAGLVWFFTQTETGKQAWESLTTALVDGWNWVTEKLSAGIDWIVEKFTQFTGWISTAWSGITALFSGDYTGALSEAFGIEEDSPIIIGFFFLRDTISSVIEWIKTAWQGLGAGISAIYQGFIKPVFDAFLTAGQVLVAVISTLVIAPLIIAWNLLSAAWQLGYNNLIKPVIDGFAIAATWLWENVLSPVLSWIGEGWTRLGEGLSATWLWIDENMVQPFAAGISWLGEQFAIAVDWIGERWAFGQALLHAGWVWIDSVVFAPFRAGAQWLSDAFAMAVDWISARWSDAQSFLHTGWVWIDQNVFAALGRGLDWLKGVFQSAVDGIAKIWKGLESAAAVPVKFVIDTVWNNGILKAWNLIADFLPGIDTVEPYEPAWLGNFAQGTSNIVPGARSVNKDNVNFVSTDGRYGIGLAGGEGIAHQHVVDGLGGKPVWDRLNHVGRTRGPQAVRDEFLPVEKHGNESAAHLGNFSQGGVIDAMINIVSQKYPMLTMTSGLDNRPGYHGLGLATDWSNGSGNTPAQLALAHDIAGTYPGSAQLIYDAPGWAGNIANGQNVGAFGGYYNLAEAGPHHHHVHWAMTEAPTMPFGGGVFEGGSNGAGAGGGGFMSWIGSKARGIWDDFVSPMKDLITGKLAEFGDSKFAEIPMAFLTSVKDAAWSKISGLFGSAGGGGNIDTSGVVGTNVEMGQQLAEKAGWTGSEWNALKELWTLESNWDNNAQNPTSTAYGIPQFLDTTWAETGYAKTSDPATQIAAGITYIQGRPAYGTPSRALEFWHNNKATTGHGWYDEGGWLNPGTTMVQNDTGRPEPVFNPQQWGDIRALINAVADLHPELRRMVDQMVPQFEAMADHLSKIADPTSVEGITARGITSRVLDMDLVSYSDTMQTIMGSEVQLMDARAAQTVRAEAIVERQEALAKAQAELEELLSTEGEMSVQNQRKLDDAKKDLEEAKTAAAEAEGDKQAAAAEKVADAEEKLRRTREDIAADTDKDSAKRDEDVAKATENVAKAELDLVSARQASIEALDHIILPDSVGGFLPQLEMAATAIGGHVPEVASALSGLAAVALPAGVSLGTALTALQIALDVGREIWSVAEDIQTWFTTLRVSSAQAMSSSMSSIREWTSLVDNQQQVVSQLRQSLAGAQIEMVSAQWNLRTAQADMVRAQLTGVKNVADAEAALEAERERVARNAWWDYNDMSLAYDRLRWAQREGIKDQLDGYAQVTPEILALQHEVRAAQLGAQAEVYTAMIGSIKAGFALNRTIENMTRMQADLEKQTQRLAQMQSGSFGMDMGEALVGEELAKLYADLATAQGEKDSLDARARGFFGDLVDLDNDGKIFGIIDNPWSQENQAYNAQIAQIQEDIVRWQASEYAPDFTDAQWKEAMEAARQAGIQYAAGRDAAGDAILQSSILGEADRKLREQAVLGSVYDWQDSVEESRRAEADLLADLAEFSETFPLEQYVYSLQAGSASEQYSADAIRADNPAVQAALKALAEFEASNAADARVRSEGGRTILEVTIPEQSAYSREQMEAVLDAFRQVDDIDLRVSRLEQPERPTALDVMANRRR